MPIELIIWFSGLFIWGAYDLYAVIADKRTLSQWIWRKAKDKPYAVPFLFGLISGLTVGLIGGHLFL